MSILINNVGLDGDTRDIYIKDNRIADIGEHLDVVAEVRLDGTGKIAIPTFINGHTHAAMTLLRGYADDMPLQEWLQTKIWPLEAHLTEEDVYWGSKLACLEMIKTGTTFFSDMYWHSSGTARAVEEMGIRAAISAVFIDFFDDTKTQEQIADNERLFALSRQYGPRVMFQLGPHAIYTVSDTALQWCADFAQKHDLLVHLHLSETEEEVNRCIDAHGVRPVHYLERLGILGPNLVACHCVWVDDEEIDILQAHGVRVVHVPVSNQKLAVGGTFPYAAFHDRGVPIGLGTDGCASNNNLDMLETAKFASLLQKFHANSPVALPAGEALQMLTSEGARVFHLDCGTIAPGKLADIALIDCTQPQLVPHFHTDSDLIYSANGSCVDTVICDGRILMQAGHVEGEEEICEKAREVAFDVVRRASG